jgi:hypothetical protein
MPGEGKFNSWLGPHKDDLARGMDIGYLKTIENKNLYYATAKSLKHPKSKKN